MSPIERAAQPQTPPEPPKGLTLEQLLAWLRQAAERKQQLPEQNGATLGIRG